MAKFKVDGWNNFCRIFELPEKYSNEYCFGGGIATNFQMVDWFNPIKVGDGFQPAISKEQWIEKVGKYDVEEVTTKELKKQLSDFILKKQYIKKGRKYLFIADFGVTFIVSGD